MSSSGLIYAVIVGAWAAYLVPMWLRRQDELNEARPTERFSTAIRLLSGRAAMERRYSKGLDARAGDSDEPSNDGPDDEQRPGDRQAEPRPDEPDVVTDSVDVRAFAMPPGRKEARARVREEPRPPRAPEAPDQARSNPRPPSGSRTDRAPHPDRPTRQGAQPPTRGSAPGAAARARRSKALARRRRTTMVLFLAFTLGAIVAAVGGLTFLWAPALPAVLLSAYIAYLRSQERRRFTYTMDRRRAEAAAQRLRERDRQPRRRSSAEPSGDEAEEGPGPETGVGMSSLAADRRALVEQTDHAEWVDQQRERRHGPSRGDSWDPVPVPLPTYVTAPVAPRATGHIDLGAPDAWSSARSSTAEPAQAPARPAEPSGPGPSATDDDRDGGADDGPESDGGPSDGSAPVRRAASARRSRERGRTPLFDQYEDGDRPRAANE